MHQYLILLGGNVGNVAQAFAKAAQLLGTVGKVVRTSGIYSSPSWGFSAPDFLNAVVELSSELEPEALLDETQSIELQLGRTAKSVDGHYSSRTIDIDILYCDRLLIDTPRLQIPHPLIARRRFTLIPLAECWSYQFDTRQGKTVKELLSACSDEGEVKFVCQFPSVDARFSVFQH